MENDPPEQAVPLAGIDEKGQGARARGRGPLMSRLADTPADASQGASVTNGESTAVGNAGTLSSEAGQGVVVGNVARNQDNVVIEPGPAEKSEYGAHAAPMPPRPVMGESLQAKGQVLTGGRGVPGGGGTRRSFELVGTTSGARPGLTTASATHGERKDKNVRRSAARGQPVLPDQLGR